MAIVVVGGGAIGLLVAGRLALAGRPPSALLARPRSAVALAAQPLRMVAAGQAQTIPSLIVAGSPAALPEPFRAPDLAILCVKGYDTPEAIETLQALNPRTILTLQNGIGNEERLVEAFGARRVIAGAITTSVDLSGPSEIIVTKEGGIGLAPIAPAADLAPWAGALQGAGFQVQIYADYRALKWSKALLNMLGNAQAAILDMPVDRIYADRRLVALDLRAVGEALAVMRKLGAKPVNLPRYPAARLALALRLLPPPILQPLLRRIVGGGRGGKDPSLLRDLRAGRARSEGAFLYGAVAEAAQAHGLPAPANAGLWRILSSIAAGATPWDTYRGNPDRLLAAVRSDLE